MKYGKAEDGRRIEACRSVAATCPNCGSPLIAKCGRIKVHHWAHSVVDCDPWWEPETEWHRAWKEIFPAEWVEVPLGEHRADVPNSSGLVIELQNSSISPAEIEARERFYRRMVWIVNGARFADSFFLMKAMDAQKGLFSFRWKHAKASWRFAKMPVFIDFGEISIAELLGMRQTKLSQRMTQAGVEHDHDRTTIRRVETKTSEHEVVDPSLLQLPEDLLATTMVRLNTLHASGWGSAVAMRRRHLLEIWGADQLG